MFDSFSNNPIVSIVSLILAAIGILLAVVFYLKSRRIKRISYAVRSFNLIDDSVSSLPGFAASYNGNEFDNLTALKILFWNSGSELLSGNDIASSDPVRLEFPQDVTVLDAKVSLSSNTANLAEVIIDSDSKNRCVINFDFLSEREGFILSVLSTGKPESNPVVEGTIKGGGSPTSYRRHKSYLLFNKILFYFVVAIAIFIGVQFQSTWQKWFFGVASGVILSALWAVNSVNMEKMASRELDRSFEKFFPSDFT
jgi:hypothetical protein